MTHREARRKLGSRTVRRSGTKTQIIPGLKKSGGKGSSPKFRRWRRQKPRPAVLVRRILAGGSAR